MKITTINISKHSRGWSINTEYSHGGNMSHGGKTLNLALFEAISRYGALPEHIYINGIEKSLKELILLTSEGYYRAKFIEAIENNKIEF